MKSKLFIIAGHNGAGKTTFLKTTMFLKMWFIEDILEVLEIFGLFIEI